MAPRKLGFPGFGGFRGWRAFRARGCSVVPRGGLPRLDCWNKSRLPRLGRASALVLMPSVVRKFLEIFGLGIVAVFTFVSSDFGVPPRHLALSGRHKVRLCFQWDIQKTDMRLLGSTHAASYATRDISAVARLFVNYSDFCSLIFLISSL